MADHEKQLVLMVDDDLELLMLFTTDLSEEFRILTARDGEDGLIKALQNKPDLIVSDINMPELNGWELCYLVRQIPSTRAIPFIFLSSRSDLPDKIKGLRLGADDYMSKPFSLDDVAHHMRVVLGRVKNRKQVVEGITVGAEVNTLLLDLLEYLRAVRRSGVIDYSRIDKVGKISLSNGNIVDADFENFHGEEALRMMLQMGTGEISFKEKQIEKNRPILNDWTSFVGSFLPPE